MASILYAWEFGANLGHVGAFMPLAKALRNNGHTVHWVVSQPAQVGAYLASEGFTWLPAPTLPEQPRPGAPLTYADILLRFGYADPKALFGLVGGWRELMRLTKAQLVMTDHAPTAVLAARTLTLPVMTFSYGFTAPPRQYPFPNMRPWVSVPEEAMMQSDLTALFAVNNVLARHGCAQMEYLANLFDVAESALITFPELDHYSNRGPASYWGCLVSSMSGLTPQWPLGAGPRIFGYLRQEVRHAEALLAALGELGHPSLVVFPDIPNDMLQRCRHPNVAISKVPLETSVVLQQADMAVTYGGHGLTTAFLLAGKPLLLLPGQLEQFMLALRIEEIGAGLLLDPEKPATDIAQKLRRVASEPFFAGNAQAFARKYAAFPQEVVIDNLVRRIEELAA